MKVKNYSASTYFLPLQDQNQAWCREETNSEDHEHRKQKFNKSGGYLSFVQFRNSLNHGFVIPADIRTFRFMSRNNSILTYSFGSSLLNLGGYKIQINTEGGRAFSGLKILKESKFKSLPGLDIPEDYRVLKAIKLTDFDAINMPINQEVLLASIYIGCYTCDERYGKTLSVQEMADIINGSLSAEAIDLIQSVEMPNAKTSKKIQEEEDKAKAKGQEYDDSGVTELEDYAPEFIKMRKHFMSIWGDFTAFNPKLNALANIYQEDALPHKTEVIDLDGLGYCSRFVPKKEWFSEKIRNKVSLDVLSLFPEAEREVFGIFLGRTAAGREGQVYSNGQSNKLIWRGLPILVQQEGGLGKSITAALIADTFNKLGYTYGSLPPSLSGGFGFAEAARSDLGYVDDCSPNSIAEFLGSPQFKSLISNSSRFVAHQKGKDHVTVKAPKCALFMITNSFPTHKIDLDGGMVSRVLPMKLYCSRDKEAKEFTDKTGLPFSMDRAITELAKQCNTTAEVLVMYLIRLCVDKWQSYKSQDELLEELYGHTDKFRINLKKDHNKAMMMHYLLICKRAEEYTNGFEAGHFLKVLRYSLTNNFKNKKGKCPWMPNIPQCTTTPEQMMILFDSLTGTKKSIKLIFSEFMDNITSVSGGNYNKYINHWVELYNDCKHQLEGYTEEGDEEMYGDKLLLDSWAEKELKMFEESKQRMKQYGLSQADIDNMKPCTDYDREQYGDKLLIATERPDFSGNRGSSMLG